MLPGAHALWGRFLSLVARAFKPAARYPADPRAVFLLALSVFTGLTALVLRAAPTTLNSILPTWGTTLWGVLLMVGSFVTLIGVARQDGNGIIIEQIGSVMVGATSIFYAVLALKVAGDDALQPISIVLGWGIACFFRWGQLQSLINQELVKKTEREIEALVEARLGERE